jgi:hypothetical protein
MRAASSSVYRLPGATWSTPDRFSVVAVARDDLGGAERAVRLAGHEQPGASAGPAREQALCCSEFGKHPMPIRAIILASLVAIIPLDALARDHGEKRDPNSITALVVHTIGGPACVANTVRFMPIPKRDDDAQFWQRFLKIAPNTEAHYVIGRNGAEAQVMPLTEIANHTVGINDVSIGIELVHRGDGIEPFEEPQVTKLIEVIKDIRQEFPKISISNIVAHSDIDQRTCSCGEKPYHRRQDPGANFPMQRVIDAVRTPSDGEYGPSSLPRLVGPAPTRACASYRH